ncbi:PhzF family phenazine biosynthesis protein [Alkalihalobacillus deserti]|uniref:PhzF family phenazine biosynthesis protein n=1 Tax=Alkalihalobacillus deserti TaxID=2879466 RepID=UPI0027DF46B3|nr:PhzF family phenazine biosynthesis protein [Alkalihalobacillus deserti]
MIKQTFEFVFFTPSNEIDFCGHTTLGSTWILVSEYGWGEKETIRLETIIGIISLEIADENLMMTQVKPKVKDIELNLDTVSTLMGLSVEDIDRSIQSS